MAEYTQAEIDEVVRQLNAGEVTAQQLSEIYGTPASEIEANLAYINQQNGHVPPTPTSTPVPTPEPTPTTTVNTGAGTTTTTPSTTPTTTNTSTPTTPTYPGLPTININLPANQTPTATKQTGTNAASAATIPVVPRNTGQTIGATTPTTATPQQLERQEARDLQSFNRTLDNAEHFVNEANERG